jgi:hypothetical protein
VPRRKNDAAGQALDYNGSMLARTDRPGDLFGVACFGPVYFHSCLPVTSLGRQARFFSGPADVSRVFEIPKTSL